MKTCNGCYFSSFSFTARQGHVNGLSKCAISSSGGLSGFIISLHPSTALLSAEHKCLPWIMTLLWDFSIARISAAFPRGGKKEKDPRAPTMAVKEQILSFSNFKCVTVMALTHPNTYATLRPNINTQGLDHWVVGAAAGCNYSETGQPRPQIRAWGCLFVKRALGLSFC